MQEESKEKDAYLAFEYILKDNQVMIKCKCNKLMEILFAFEYYQFKTEIISKTQNVITNAPFVKIDNFHDYYFLWYRYLVDIPYETLLTQNRAKNNKLLLSDAAICVIVYKCNSCQVEGFSYPS